MRYTAGWWMLGLVISVDWYWKVIPASILSKALLAMPTPISSIHIAFWAAGGVAVLLVGFGLVLPGRMPFDAAVLLMAAGLAWCGAFEWFRESLRKPYIVTGYIYGNGVDLSRTDEYRKEGYLVRIAYPSGDAGADLFRHTCRTCHTISGYKPLKPAFDGTDRAFIAATIQSIHLSPKP